MLFWFSLLTNILSLRTLTTGLKPYIKLYFNAFFSNISSRRGGKCTFPRLCFSYKSTAAFVLTLCNEPPSRFIIYTCKLQYTKYTIFLLQYYTSLFNYFINIVYSHRIQYTTLTINQCATHSVSGRTAISHHHTERRIVGNEIILYIFFFHLENIKTQTPTDTDRPPGGNVRFSVRFRKYFILLFFFRTWAMGIHTSCKRSREQRPNEQ